LHAVSVREKTVTIRVSGDSTGAHGDSALTRTAVERARAGDAEGLHFLYVRFVEDVQRYVASIVKDHHDAEDITQNVFAKLLTAIHKYEERKVPFDAWLLRVARNAALDHLRAKRSIPTEEVRVDDNGDAEAELDRGSALREALEELPPEQREVLVLRHVVGLSPVEIADALDKSESSVHGLHHRGRRSLRTHLQDLGAAPVVSRPAA
jgi:RNA polymerase sigma-70 factor, ECF subfamily